MTALQIDLLMADLLWLEYEDAAAAAQEAYIEGDMLWALYLAIEAYKIRGRYEAALHRALFG